MFDAPGGSAPEGPPRPGDARSPHPFQPTSLAETSLAGAPDWAARHLIPAAPPPNLVNGASFDALHPPAVRGESACACVTYYDRRNLRRDPLVDSRYVLDGANPGPGPAPADLHRCLTADPARGRPALVPAPVTYQPALYDSEGRLVPYDRATWKLDVSRGCVEFPWGLPPRLAASAAKPTPFRLSFFVYTGPRTFPGPAGAAGTRGPPGVPKGHAAAPPASRALGPADSVSQWEPRGRRRGVEDPRGCEGDAVFVSSGPVGPHPTGEESSPYGSLGQALAGRRAAGALCPPALPLGHTAPLRVVLLGDAPHRLPLIEGGIPPIEVRGRAAVVGEGVVLGGQGAGGLLALAVSCTSPGEGGPKPGDIVLFPRTRVTALVGEASPEGGGYSLLLALPSAGADCAEGDTFLIQRQRATVVLSSPVELGPSAWENVDFVVPEGAGALRLAAKAEFTQCRFTVGPNAGLLVEGGVIVAGHPARGWADPSAAPARAGLCVAAARGGTFVRRAATWAPDRLEGCVFEGAVRLSGAFEIGSAHFRGEGHQLVFSGGASEVANAHFHCEPRAGRALLQADSGAFLQIRSVAVIAPPSDGAVALFATQGAIVEAAHLRVCGAGTALEARSATVRVRSSALEGGTGDGAVAAGGSTLDLIATTVAGFRGRGISATDSVLLLTDTTVRGSGQDGVDAVNCRVAITCTSEGPDAGHVSSNGGAGVRARAGSTGRLDGLRIANNADTGLVVDGASSLVWSRCIVAGNSGGVRVSGCSRLDSAQPYIVSGNNAPGADGGVGVSVRGASSCCLGAGRVDGHSRTQAEATPQSRVEHESGEGGEGGEGERRCGGGP